MNDDPNLVETILRQAPLPRPPADLKGCLLAEAPATPRQLAPHRPRTDSVDSIWVWRWWPSLAMASLTLLGLVVLAVQRSEIQELRRAVEELKNPRPHAGAAPSPAAARAGVPSRGESALAPSQLRHDRQELARLRELAKQAAGEVQALEAARQENERLRQATAQARSAGSLSEDMEAMKAARAKAQQIQCVNNLKQMGLAVRVWATDNQDVFPPTVLDMTNELVTPKVLVCPADTSRQPAASWQDFSAAHLSYEFLAPNGSVFEPQRVLFRCPIHGNVGLCDGSVQSGVAKEHPDWLVQRDGKLYLERPAR